MLFVRFGVPGVARPVERSALACRESSGAVFLLSLRPQLFSPASSSQRALPSVPGFILSLSSPPSGSHVCRSGARPAAGVPSPLPSGRRLVDLDDLEPHVDPGFRSALLELARRLADACSPASSNTSALVASRHRLTLIRHAAARRAAAAATVGCDGPCAAGQPRRPGQASSDQGRRARPLRGARNARSVLLSSSPLFPADMLG